MPVPTTTTVSIITPEVLAYSMDYATYKALIEWLVAEEKTSGPEQTEKLVGYTKLNLHRMKRVEHTTKLDETTVVALQSITKPLTWLVLTEAWCGDAAQIVPALHTMSALNPVINLRFILRDEYLSIMDEFLTNGSRSIPKVLFVNPETLNVFGSWGPRPETAQELYMQWKSEQISPDERATRLHKWYADDKTRSTQRSFINALQLRR